MNRPAYRLSAIGLLMLITCAACSSGNDDVLGVSTNWLGPLHRYERQSGADSFGVFVRKEGTRPARVKQLILAPAEITVSAASDFNSLDPAAYEKVRAAFSDALKKHIAASARSSSADADADAYILRIALTNLTVKRNTTKIGPVSLDELEFAFNGAAIEASLSERSTNARRAVFAHKADAGKALWKDLGTLFDRFARQAAEKTAEARAAIDRKASLPEKPAEKTAEKTDASQK
tara:strand:+ start:17568 stop:18269 length:702 start_codon:yes stop_codon:yes gene_type:complete